MINRERRGGRALRGLAVAAVVTAACGAAARAQKAPDETLSSLKVADGLEVTTWATEPALVNPTNMDIDERGRIWITEAANYRGSKTRPEGDRIVILEDTDLDGKADSSKTFYQHPSLFAPLGICKVGDKLFVSQSPNVLVFTIDASGDKPVGAPQVVFTGFTGENHDHGVHAMVFGPDGRFYFNAGNDGCKGTISGADGKPVVDTLGSSVARGDLWRGGKREKGVLGYTDGMAFRFNPDGTGFETLGHNFRNNYELTVDSFGTVWQSDNDDDGNQSARINFVMEGGNYGFKGPTGNNWGRDQGAIPGQTKQEAHWHQRWPGVVPNMLHTGMGSPTGIVAYEGDLLPERFRNTVIHCDPGPNVVRAYRPTPSAQTPSGLTDLDKAPSAGAAGAGYAAETIEVVMGEDRWFGPADVCVAPDGSVFIADWYDPGVGGHATGDKPDQGGLRGRVYRLAPKGHKATRPAHDFASAAGAIEALKSPNLAVRYLAYQRLAADPQAVAPLSEMFKNDPNPRLRARALWLLARTPAGAASVQQALADKDENIRIAGLRAARMTKQDMVAVADKMIGDASPGVLREIAVAMNYEPAERAVPVLVKLADRYDGKDRWYLEAIGIGATDKEEQLLAAWKKDGKNAGDAEVANNLTWRLKREGPESSAASAPTDSQLVQSWLALGPFDAAGRDKNPLAHNYGPDAAPGRLDPAAAFKGVGGKAIKWEKIDRLDEVDGTVPGVDFAKYCTDRGSRGVNVVGYFATTVTSPAEQKAKLVLGSDDGVRVWLNGKQVYEIDGSRAIAYPQDVVDVSLKKGPNLLLIKLRQGDGSGGVTAGVTAKQPVTFATDFQQAPAASAGAGAGRTGATSSGANPADAIGQKTKDGETLPSLDALAALPGDPARGAAVYRNQKAANCITCHQVGTEGQMIGPPLTTVGQKLTKPQLFEAILLPNAGILMHYENWVVRTKKGDVVSGLLESETPEQLTIKDTAGKYHDIPVENVDRKVMQKLSLMPEGLAGTMTKQELVDLVAYLATLQGPQ